MTSLRASVWETDIYVLSHYLILFVINITHVSGRYLRRISRERGLGANFVVAISCFFEQ